MSTIITRRGQYQIKRVIFASEDPAWSASALANTAEFMTRTPVYGTRPTAYICVDAAGETVEIMASEVRRCDLASPDSRIKPGKLSA